jgi:hypothetical protein
MGRGVSGAVRPVASVGVAPLSRVAADQARPGRRWATGPDSPSTWRPPLRRHRHGAAPSRADTVTVQRGRQSFYREKITVKVVRSGCASGRSALTLIFQANPLAPVTSDRHFSCGLPVAWKGRLEAAHMVE